MIKFCPQDDASKIQSQSEVHIKVVINWYLTEVDELTEVTES